jgi:hypothetical protein
MTAIVCAMGSYGGNVGSETIPNKMAIGKPAQPDLKFLPKKTLSFSALPAMLLIPPAKKPLVEPSSWWFAPGLHRPGAFFARSNRS